MSNASFKDEMILWINGVNNTIKRQKLNIILDSKIFPYNESEKVYRYSKSAKDMLSAKYLFIGDNPGKNERDHRTYFYYEADKQWIKDNRSTAGVKFQKLIERTKLNRKDYITFNKCLIYSDSTNDLSMEDIANTQNIVIKFIEIIKKYNPDIKIIFMGMNCKFVLLLRKFGTNCSNTILIPHPCRSMYKYKDKGKYIVVVNPNNLTSMDHFFEKWERQNLWNKIVSSSQVSNGSNLKTV